MRWCDVKVTENIDSSERSVRRVGSHAGHSYIALHCHTWGCYAARARAPDASVASNRSQLTYNTYVRAHAQPLSTSKKLGQRDATLLPSYSRTAPHRLSCSCTGRVIIYAVATISAELFLCLRLRTVFAPLNNLNTSLGSTTILPGSKLQFVFWRVLSHFGKLLGLSILL